MMKHVDQVMQLYLPDLNTIGEPGVLEGCIEDLEEAMLNGSYTFSSVMHGTEYLKQKLSNRSLWHSNWLIARRKEIKIRFLTLQIFQDDFGGCMCSTYYFYLIPHFTILLIMYVYSETNEL
jgi:hypothetical protein